VPIVATSKSILASGLIAVVGAVGCSQNGTNALTGNSPDGAAGDAGTGGATGFVARRGCQSNADCSEHATCLQFGGGGPTACEIPPVAVTSCPGSNPRNQCCATSDCAAGSCFTIETQPVQCSSTAGVDVYNACIADGCAGDGDCATGQLCTPVGYSLARSCIAAGCRSDADCTAESGGVCVLLELGCCTPQIGGNTFRKTQLACAYPSNGCQIDADCPGGFCTVTGGRASCATNCR